MVKKNIFLFTIICLANISLAQLPKTDHLGNSNKVIVGIVDTLRSGILSETRVLNIYLPEEYSPDTAVSYPVIYLLDGGADEDFIHIAGLVRYLTTPWIKQFPKSIVVGIENTNRKRDLTFATPNLDFVSRMGFAKNSFPDHGGSEKFISFIEKELQPFIQTHYKTNSSKTIIGESLAGLLATEILLKNPSLFDTYIIISPSLWWGEESLLKEKSVLSKRSFSSKLKIYVAASNKAEDPIMFNDAQNLAQVVKKYNQSNISVTFDYLPQETHATIQHQAVYNAFKLLYPKKK